MITPKISFWNIFEKNFYTDKRIVINRGGSSSGKTGTLIRMILVWLFHGQIDNSGKVFERWTLSVVRKYTSNLTKSVLRDWENILDETETRQFLEINKTEKTYKFQNRTVEFIGIDDPQKARWPRREILYCNEANELTYEDFRQLAMRTNYRIFIDFNPDDEDIWINTELEQRRAITDGDVDVIVSTYRDNPFLSPEIVKELERLKDIDPTYWQVYGEGQYGRLEGRIFDFKEIVEVPESAKLLWYGLDFGFTNDPTAVVAVYEYGERLILDEIIYESGLTNDDICRRLDSENIAKTAEIWADSSEPKSIEEIYRKGYNIHAVEKWPDSVRFWIDTMKNLKYSLRLAVWTWKKKDENTYGKKIEQVKVLMCPSTTSITLLMPLAISWWQKRKKKSKENFVLMWFSEQFPFLGIFLLYIL